MGRLNRGRIYKLKEKTECHHREQRLLEVWDWDKDAPGTYATKDIHAWFGLEV